MQFHGEIFSATLEMATGLTIAGPDHFSDVPYQVCYLLHGLCGNDKCWERYTRLPVYAEEHNILFVMPDAARSFYTDMRYGVQYLQYISEELPEICKNLFHISSKREDTFAIGCSMGGYGAIKAAFGHPERFGACAALSPCCLMIGEEMDELRCLPQEQAIKRYGTQLMRDFTAIFGSELALCPQDNPIRLAEQIAIKQNCPKFYLACGKQDSYLQDCRRYHAILDSLNIQHTYQEFNGAHDWYCFDETLCHTLKWLTASQPE